MDTNTRVGRSFAVFGSFWPGKAACAVALGIGLLSGCGGGDVADETAGAQEAQMEPLERSAKKGDGNKRWPTSTPETSTTTTTTTPTTTSPTTSTTTTTTTTTSPTGTVPVSDRAPLGVNIEGLWDWARLQPFVDLMKTSRPWGTPDAPWDEAAQVDALGWPTADAGVVVNVRTYEPGDETKAYRYMTPGVYQLRFTGRASVGPSASTDVVIRNYTYDSATNRSHAEVVVGTAATQLMLTFRNTVGGVRDVSLRMPGYDDAQTFTNQFIQALTPFQVVRFMDFLRTNNNPVRTWAERTTPASGSQISPRGAAHEYAIQVANQLGKDIWINVPALADDAYVRSLATLLKQSLAPGRVVYVEYSNELWNFQFSQTTANMQLAVAEAVAGDTTLTRGQPCTQEMFNAGTGECNSYWAGYFRVGKRTVRIAQIFSEVFGAPAMNNQVRVVYATQFVNPGIAEQVLKNIATYRAQPSSLLYGVATAPYFYLAHDLVGSTVATKEQLLQSMETSLRTDVEPYFAAGVMNQGVFVRGPYTGGNYTGASHKALADYYGLKSLAYEGGPDFGQNAANTTTKVAANRELKMGELVKSEVTQWFGCGNDLYMYFSLSSAWDRHGYWGLTNDPTDLNTPKYAAVRDVAQTARSSLTTCR
jgi:hypothetical protein